MVRNRKTLNWKSLSSFILVCSMMLSACSSGGDQKGNTGQSPANGSPAPTSAASEPPKEELPKLTLDWFVTAPANANLPSKAEDFVIQEIESRFNVDLNLTYMATGNDYVNKTNTLLASNPPIMFRDANGDGGNKYILDGLIADMTPYVTPEKMPNYFKYWITELELERYQVQDQFARAPIPYDRNIYRTLYIRKDWLDNLGLGVPANYDEYVEALRQFRNNDPDQNSKKDTYGFTTAGNGEALGLEWPEYLNNGLPFPRNIENNVFKDMQVNPEIQFVIDDIVQLIEEDLIDPDWYLNKAPQHIEKAIQGRAGVVMGTTLNFAYDSNPDGIQARTKQLFPDAEWVPMNLFPDMNQAVKPNPGNPFLFSKKAADRHPEQVERTVAILDWLAGEEGYVLTHYGQEGVHYNRAGNEITLDIDAYTKGIIQKGNFLSIWQFSTPVEAPEQFGLTVIDPRMTDRDREIKDYFQTIKLIENEGVSYIAPEGFDLAAFRKRQRELQSKAVLEDKSGNNWPAYYEELLTTYKGQQLFDKYSETLKAVMQ
ncbi:extracellular solute-binding protein [Paenibacillus sp. PAMC21692]|uniref:extracellular solute-binding protein n=1 Tax=Paenibacillus sp. PAMC21692 TaxID=2762320 RepID=UPI00164E4DA0|nr:extracellular solute-binding protein [Paenibacillus sp. PAMC21692]QNK57228.1 extracellular solute-binding protein [Paenibacillus sp. PAMC21692]